MKNLVTFFLFAFFIGLNFLQSQCNYIKPPTIKKIEYANRELTFSDVKINGKTTTILKVRKNEPINVSVNISSKKNGNYCNGCIVQVYWGINDYTSTCAKSFQGYNFNQITSSQNFKAPNKNGIYYITMGGSLEYSCKNNKQRPSCSPNKAFAVLVVGNPKSGTKISLKKTKKGNLNFLTSKLIGEGCFGNLSNTDWYLNGRMLPFKNAREIPLQQSGLYRVQWSNCAQKISKTFRYKTSEIVTIEQPVSEPTPLSENLEELISNNDRFVLKNLIFNQGKAYLKPKAKQELDKLAKIMFKNPNMRIRLEGHTDYRGNARQNKRLSKRRVKTARKYLKRKGISYRRIEYKGFGEEKPLIVDEDIEKCKINRRVEVVVLSR